MDSHIRNAADGIDNHPSSVVSSENSYSSDPLFVEETPRKKFGAYRRRAMNPEPEDLGEEPADLDEEPAGITETYGKINNGEGSSKPRARGYGIRAMANGPLLRDELSDEDDLRPSHLIEAERERARAQRKFEKYGTLPKEKNKGKGKGKEIATLDGYPTSDSDYDLAFGRQRDPEEDFQRQVKEAEGMGEPLPERRPTTPEQEGFIYDPYNFYDRDYESPPGPSRGLPSPGAYYPSRGPYEQQIGRPDHQSLTDVASVRPEDLFDADDVGLEFTGPTDREMYHAREYERQEREAAEARRGRDGRGPYRDEAWNYHAFEWDAGFAPRGEAGQGMGPPPADIGEGDRKGLGRGGRATVAGLPKKKRKYKWKDVNTKNKRRKKGSVEEGSPVDGADDLFGEEDADDLDGDEEEDYDGSSTAPRLSVTPRLSGTPQPQPVYRY